MSKYYLFIKADTNDADYISQLTLITKEEYELIFPVINAIKEFESYEYVDEDWMTYTHCNNYPTGEAVREDLGEKHARELYGHLEGFDHFDEEFVPFGEFGIHTIEEIRILEVVNEKELI